jgi:hypothetical protein
LPVTLSPEIKSRSTHERVCTIVHEFKIELLFVINVNGIAGDATDVARGVCV